MSIHIARHSYGKSNVRVSRILREGSHNHFIELTVSISLEGDFEAAYTNADNRLVIPTDTMKNTVYILAQRHELRSIESFSVNLCEHFLKEYSQIQVVTVDIEQKPWRPIRMDETQHAHTFVGSGSERWQCSARAEHHNIRLQSGLHGLQVLKSTASGFRDFYRDDYTTLADTEDRILATTIAADWPVSDTSQDWSTIRQTIRACLLKSFAIHTSASVQHSIRELAKHTLDRCPEIDEISISCPNQHYLLVDLSPFGISNENELFVPTEEPYGLIGATVSRA